MSRGMAKTKKATLKQRQAACAHPTVIVLHDGARVCTCCEAVMTIRIRVEPEVLAAAHAAMATRPTVGDSVSAAHARRLAFFAKKAG
jgi:hypothetical protein